MKNTLGDLNNHLFAQLERLSDEDLDIEQLNKEIQRSKAISDVASKIIDNANVVLAAQKLKVGMIDIDNTVPKMLEG